MLLPFVIPTQVETVRIGSYTAQDVLANEHDHTIRKLLLLAVSLKEREEGEAVIFFTDMSCLAVRVSL